ncbi:hypothetical protein PR048_008457 [Dryococelus australis]|uniref:Uncharacterized protein n=1 Tax=Dryococelus australis TaxID=614101 RepID=A0ABQ9HX64_9NEOP|nr:hypothetical protein PR048_008457 [Dryococelus australis]
MPPKEDQEVTKLKKELEDITSKIKASGWCSLISRESITRFIRVWKKRSAESSSKFVTTSYGFSAVHKVLPGLGGASYSTSTEQVSRLL